MINISLTDIMKNLIRKEKNPSIFIFPFGKNGGGIAYQIREKYGYKKLVYVDNEYSKYNSDILDFDHAIERFQKGDLLLITSPLPEIMGTIYRCNKLSVREDVYWMYDRTELINRYNMRQIHLMDVARMIYENNISGNVAEAGVYQGHFAQYINLLFPDRQLYLFDTFEGFPGEKISKNDIYSDYKEFIDIGKDTNTELVMNKMKYKENIIIKKGTVPDIFVSVEESFCFVNLDMDLYSPTLEGLKWFYPRLNAGGYIFIHDFYKWEGVRCAVMEYCVENSIGCFPLSDNCSVVIAK